MFKLKSMDLYELNFFFFEEGLYEKSFETPPVITLYINVLLNNYTNKLKGQEE